MYLALFFFNDTATTEIYTLSLHDALPILCCPNARGYRLFAGRNCPKISRYGWPLLDNYSSRRPSACGGGGASAPKDRKSTRLNSSHANISYAVFCLKKKKDLPMVPSVQSI